MDNKNYNHYTNNPQGNSGFQNYNYNAAFYDEDYDKTEVQFPTNSKKDISTKREYQYNSSNDFTHGSDGIHDRTMTTEEYKRLNYYTDPSATKNYNNPPGYYGEPTSVSNHLNQANYYNRPNSANQPYYNSSSVPRNYSGNQQDCYYDASNTNQFYQNGYDYYEEPTTIFPQEIAVDTSSVSRKRKRKTKLIVISLSLLVVLLSTSLVFLLRKDSSNTEPVQGKTEPVQGKTDHYWPSKCSCSDGSTIYFYEDGTYAWYMDEQNSLDVNLGTYTVTFGADARQKLITDLSEYGVTADEIDQMYVNPDNDIYKLENLTVLILTTNSLIIDGEEQVQHPYTTPYFGHSNTVLFDGANMKSANYCTFIFDK